MGRRVAVVRAWRLGVLVGSLALAACNGAPPPPEVAPGPAPADEPAETAADPVQLPSGLQYIDLVAGTGDLAVRGKMARVHYTGWLLDGTEFDSSWNRRQPFDFPLGAGQVIAGWDLGVENMRVGGRRQLIIPPQLAYGETGAPPDIPPDATLVFEVDLLAVYDAPPQAQERPPLPPPRTDRG